MSTAYYDDFGLPVTTTSAESAHAYAFMQRCILGERSSDEAIRTVLHQDSQFALAWADSAWHYAASGAEKEAKRAMSTAMSLVGSSITERERSHVAILAKAYDKGLPAVAGEVQTHIAFYPRDATIVNLAATLIQQSGATVWRSTLRSFADYVVRRVGEVDWFSLAQLASAAELDGDLASAERYASQSLTRNGTNSIPVHVVAHVRTELEQHKRGIAWLSAWLGEQGDSCNIARHLRSHLALHLVLLGDHTAATSIAFEICEDAVRTSEPQTFMDAVSLLWRLQIRQSDDHSDFTGFWIELASTGQSLFGQALSPLLDLHILIAFAATSSLVALDDALAELRSASSTGQAPKTLLEIGVGLKLLFEDPESTARTLAGVIRGGDLSHLGGSRVQVDLVEETVRYAGRLKRRKDQEVCLASSRPVAHKQAEGTTPTESSLGRKPVSTTASELSGLATAQLGKPQTVLNQAEAAFRRGDYGQAVEGAQAAVVELRSNCGTPEEVVQALLLQAWSLDRLGRYSEAGHVLSGTTDYVSNLVDGQGLGCQVTLALAYNARAQGDYKKAEVVLRAAIAQTETGRCLSPTSTELASLESALGLVCRYAGRIDEARVFYFKALARAERSADRLLEATLHHNLGGLEQSAGNLELAEHYARRSIDLRCGLLGDSHPDTLADKAALATVLDQRGRSGEAEEMLRYAISAFEKRYGREHLDVAINLSNLASLFHRRGDNIRAARMYSEAIALRERIQGTAHPELALPLVNLAGALAGSDETEARALVERAIAILTPQVDSEHPVLLAARQRLHLLAS